MQMQQTKTNAANKNECCRLLIIDRSLTDCGLYYQ